MTKECNKTTKFITKINSIQYVGCKYTHIQMEFESYGGDENYYSEKILKKTLSHKAMIWLQKICDSA